MVRKNKIQEQVLRDILLKMNYDSSKTLNENVTEQETMFTRNLDRIHRDPKSAAKYNKEMSEFIYEYRHGLLDIAAVGTMFIPFVGPFISVGLELANAGLYFSEGENYSGGLALIFAMIPFGQLARRIPAVKKLGEVGLKRLFQKTVIKNAKYTDDELKVLKGLNADKAWIKATSTKNILKETIKVTFKGQPLKKVITKMYYLGKRYPKLINLTKMGLTIGGLWYSYDRLADIFGIKDNSNVESETPSVSSSSTTEEKVQIVTDFDRDWDYKKDGDKYYTKRKGTSTSTTGASKETQLKGLKNLGLSTYTEDEWILTSGKSKEAIKTKVFKTDTGEYKTTKENLKIKEDLEKEYKKNSDIISSQISSQITSTSDEEKIKQVIAIFADIKYD